MPCDVFPLCLVGTYICEFQKLLHQMLSSSCFFSNGGSLPSVCDPVLSQSLAVSSIVISECSLYAVTSILTFGPTNCCSLGLLNPHIQSLQLCRKTGLCLASLFLLPVNCFQTTSWYNFRDSLIGFSDNFFGGNSLTLPVVQCLKPFHIFCSISQLFN